jgi:hypothetical protein
MEALPGLAVAVPDPVQNPGLPPHRERITDKDPAAMKRAVRTVYTLFYLSLAGSIWAIAAYMLFPIESGRSSTSATTTSSSASASRSRCSRSASVRSTGPRR